MDIRRGVLRLWVIFSALFVLGVSVSSYRTIREEFTAATRPRDSFAIIAKKFGGEMLLPIDCLEARGDTTTDYSVDNGHCWYTVGKFRELYPEYKDLADVDLSDRLYAKAGIPLTYRRPRTKVIETAGVALGVPLAAFVLGWSLTWVLAGFRGQPVRKESPLRDTLPRIFELKDMLADPSHPDAYFQNFEESLNQNPSKREASQRLERQLAVLDNDAWRDLKERAAVQLQPRDAGRGWQALFDIFSEANGFAYLKSIGSTGVRFIPRTKGKTPDLEGLRGGRLVLCEVKTINVSQDEADTRHRIHQGAIVATEASTRVGDGFLRKLSSNLENAIEQLDAQDPQRKARRIVFTVVHFDDWVGDYQREYFGQIDEYLLANPVPGADLVFCPASNLFRRTFTMKSATVFEPDGAT